MAFGTLPGQVSDGIGADSFKAALPAAITIGAGYQIANGQVLRRNRLTSPGLNYTYSQYSQADLGALPSSAGTGYILGVYNGLAVKNATTSASVNTRVSLRRLGVAQVRAGVLNGGTAITVGSSLAFSSATAASTYDVPLVGAWAIGAGLGLVLGYTVTTSLTGAVITVGSNTVAVASTTGITTTTPLTIDSGLGTQETVIPSAVTAQANATDTITIGGTFSAGTTFTVTFSSVPGGTLVVTYTSVAGDTNTAGIAASLASVINQSLAARGVNAFLNPPTVSASTITLTSANPGTGSNSYGLTVAASGGTATASAGSATFVNGTNGSFTAIFTQPHSSGAIVIGQTLTDGATLIPVPTTTGSMNVDLVNVDLALVGY